jgi:hypothetical protein
MDNDLDVKRAFDEVFSAVMRMDISRAGAGEAAAILQALKEIDQVLQVIF